MRTVFALATRYRFTAVSAGLGQIARAGTRRVSSGESVRGWINVHAMRFSAGLIALLSWLLLPLGIAAVLRTLLVTVLALVEVRAEKRKRTAVADFHRPVSILRTWRVATPR